MPMMFDVVLSCSTISVLIVAVVRVSANEAGFFSLLIVASAVNIDVSFGGKMRAHGVRRTCTATMPELAPRRSRPNRASTSEESPCSFTKQTATAPFSRASVAFARSAAACVKASSFSAHFGRPRSTITTAPFTSTEA